MITDWPRFGREFESRAHALGLAFCPPTASDHEAYTPMIHEFCSLVKSYYETEKCPLTNRTGIVTKRILEAILRNSRVMSVKDVVQLYIEANVPHFFPYCPAMLLTRNDCCSYSPGTGPGKRCARHTKILVEARRRRVAAIVCITKAGGEDMACLVGRACEWWQEFNTVWDPPREPYENNDAEAWVHPNNWRMWIKT
jgi:hypothetical protein